MRHESLLSTCSLHFLNGLLGVLIHITEGRHEVYFLAFYELADLFFAAEVVYSQNAALPSRARSEVVPGILEISSFIGPAVVSEGFPDLGRGPPPERRISLLDGGVAALRRLDGLGHVVV